MSNTWELVRSAGSPSDVSPEVQQDLQGSMLAAQQLVPPGPHPLESHGRWIRSQPGPPDGETRGRRPGRWLLQASQVRLMLLNFQPQGSGRFCSRRARPLGGSQQG